MKTFYVKLTKTIELLQEHEIQAEDEQALEALLVPVVDYLDGLHNEKVYDEELMTKVLRKGWTIDSEGYAFEYEESS